MNKRSDDTKNYISQIKKAFETLNNLESRKWYDVGKGYLDLNDVSK
jgi:hypothetical protein